MKKRSATVPYARWTAVHILVFFVLFGLAMVSSKGTGPIAWGDAGLKGNLIWFVGAAVLTIVSPVVAAIIFWKSQPVFSKFALFVLFTLVLQIFAEAFFIKVFVKNMVNPVAVLFILARCAVLLFGLSRFSSGWERLFLATNLLFWLLNVAQQLIYSTPRVLV